MHMFQIAHKPRLTEWSVYVYTMLTDKNTIIKGIIILLLFYKMTENETN